MHIFEKNWIRVFQDPKQNPKDFLLLGCGVAGLSLVLWLLAIFFAYLFQQSCINELSKFCDRTRPDLVERIACMSDSSLDNAFNISTWTFRLLFLKEEWPGLLIASGILAFFGSPLLWRFFLQRIREISKAIKDQE